MSDARHREDWPLNQWRMLQPPVWVPVLWWVLMVGSIIASAAGQPVEVCTVERPCEPETVFPIVVALVGVAALAFWWEPVSALLAGLGYGVLSIMFDPSLPGRYAGAVVICASLSGLWVMRQLRVQQARVASDAARVSPGNTGLTVGSLPQGRPRGFVAAILPGLVVAGLLLVVGSFLGYRTQTANEQVHLDRAMRASAHIVTLTNDDYQQVFQLDTGSRAGQRVSLEVTEELALGSEHLVLLDPLDPSWSRLLSEPQGYTYWFGWAMLGGFVAAWALSQVRARRQAGRNHQSPALHRIRVGHDGRAEITLGDSRCAVATVLLGGGSRTHHSAPRDAPARIWGPVADGGWVRIETADGPLPVVGPVRALDRWRGLTLPSEESPGPESPRTRALADRARAVGSIVGPLLRAALGVFIVVFYFGQVGPTWEAAHGRGVAGSFTVVSQDCSSKGPCRHYGDFRSTDGRYTFTNVEIVGASADVGESLPALFEGRNGQTPDAVFAPGWSGATETAIYLTLGLGFAIEPIGAAVVMFGLSRGRSLGRHARRRRT